MTANVTLTGLWAAWLLTRRMCPSCPQYWRMRSPLVLRALAASRSSQSNPQHVLAPRKLRNLAVEVPATLARDARRSGDIQRQRRIGGVL